MPSNNKKQKKATRQLLRSSQDISAAALPQSKSAPLTRVLPDLDEPTFERVVTRNDADLPIFERRVVIDEPVFQRLGSTSEGPLLTSEEPVFTRSLPSDRKVFQKRLTLDEPVFERLNSTSEEPVFTRSIPSDHTMEEPVTFERIIPRDPVSAAPHDVIISAVPPNVATHSTGLRVPYEMPRPRSSKTLPSYRPPPYQFSSPYIADHIIREDAMFHGNKIFVPPPHATYEETRHTDIRAEMPVPLMGRCSPPLDPTRIAFDELKNNSNFDPPITFNYTREQLEWAHERIFDTNAANLTYVEKLEEMGSVRRNQLQLEMRMASVLIQEQQHQRHFRRLLEEQLDELERM